MPLASASGFRRVMVRKMHEGFRFSPTDLVVYACIAIFSRPYMYIFNEVYTPFLYDPLHILAVKNNFISGSIIIKNRLVTICNTSQLIVITNICIQGFV